MSLSFSGLYRFDEFELDPSRRSLSRNGAVVPLTSKGFLILTYLVANPGRVVTKDELLEAAWPESFVEESNLPGYISGLRKALTDRAGYIATVPGQGYQFTAKVEAEKPASVGPASHAPELNIRQMRETTHVLIRENSLPVFALPAPKSLFHRWPLWAFVAIAVVAAVAAYSILQVAPNPTSSAK